MAGSCSSRKSRNASAGRCGWSGTGRRLSRISWYFDARMPLTDIELLQRLVAIDSTSSISNLPIAGELANYVEGAAQSIEYLRSPDEEKANLLVRFGPEGDGGLI